MQAQSELMDIPQALEAMFHRGRADHERAVRSIRWGDGPIHVLAGSHSLPAGLVAHYTLEALLHRPVILREASSFLAYSQDTVRTGAPVVVVAGVEQPPEVLEAVQSARKNGAQVLAVAPPSTDLAGQAHQLFALPDLAGSLATGLAGDCLEHAAVGFFALIAARLLARPTAALERVEKDWVLLPAEIEKAVSQFGDALRSLGTELGRASRVLFAGAGLYHASALRAAKAGGHRGSAIIATDYAALRSDGLDTLGPGAGVLFLAGSRSPFKKEAGALARELRERRLAVFAVTDVNEHEVSRQARLTVLMPDLAELPSSVLALVLAGWAAREMARPSGVERASQG